MRRLTIALPTYNRREGVLRQLHALRGLGALDDAEVEIIVGNNASDDGTREALDAFARDVHGGLRVLHYADHVSSAEENCARLAHHAAGEFVWLLSDDDVLLRPAYARLRTLLADPRQAFDCLVFDDAEGDDCERLVDAQDHTIHGELQGVLHRLEREGYVEFVEFVQRHGLTNYCALISRYVMRRELLVGAVELYAPTSIIYSHIFGFMERLHRRRVLFVRDALVWRRPSAVSKRFANLARSRGWYLYRAWTRGLVDLSMLFEQHCGLPTGWLGLVHERRNDGTTYRLLDEVAQQICRQLAFALMVREPAELMPGEDLALLSSYLRACGTPSPLLHRLHALSLEIRAFLEVSLAEGVGPGDLEEFQRLWEALAKLRSRLLETPFRDARQAAIDPMAALALSDDASAQDLPTRYQRIRDFKNRYWISRVLSRWLMRALRQVLP